MTAPLISVVLPVYNGKRFLADALRSVLAQDYQPVETIVVDDGSTDGSGDIARSFPGVRCLRQENQGHAAAKNAGIAAAAGELIAFLDADDRWAPAKLSRQAARLLADPGLGYVVCRQELFTDEGAAVPAWLRERLGRPGMGGSLPARIPSALLVRRAVLDRVGLFDPGYRHGNDTDWFFRAKDAGIRMEMLPEALLYRRYHGGNMSHEIDAMQRDLLNAVRASLARHRTGQDRPRPLDE